MRPDVGQIYIGGQQLDQMNDDARAGLRAESIGFVLQSDNLIPFLTAVENVEMAIGLAPAAAPPHGLETSCPTSDLYRSCSGPRH
jgi:predicted ABC-type transport system involved in lysophospholipase L1 biosynthesis ATPase subunit